MGYRVVSRSLSIAKKKPSVAAAAELVPDEHVAPGVAHHPENLTGQDTVLRRRISGVSGNGRFWSP